MNFLITIITTLLKLEAKTVLKSKFIKTINKFTSSNVKTGMELIKYLENPKRILTDISKIPKKHLNEALKDLQKQSQETYKNLKAKQKIQQKQEANKVYSLSSSWIQKGSFKQKSQALDIGELTIWIKSNKSNKSYGPYTYPMVERSVWNLMKTAKGKNGTGAGSIFWKYFLHSYYPSAFRDYVKNNFGTKALGSLTREYAKTPNKKDKYSTNSPYSNQKLRELKKQREKALKIRIKEHTYNQQSNNFKKSLQKQQTVIKVQNIIKQIKQTTKVKILTSQAKRQVKVHLGF